MSAAIVALAAPAVPVTALAAPAVPVTAPAVPVTAPNTLATPASNTNTAEFFATLPTAETLGVRTEALDQLQTATVESLRLFAQAAIVSGTYNETVKTYNHLAQINGNQQFAKHTEQTLCITADGVHVETHKPESSHEVVRVDNAQGQYQVSTMLVVAEQYALANGFAPYAESKNAFKTLVIQTVIVNEYFGNCLLSAMPAVLRGKVESVFKNHEILFEHLFSRDDSYDFVSAITSTITGMLTECGTEVLKNLPPKFQDMLMLNVGESEAKLYGATLASIADAIPHIDASTENNDHVREVLAELDALNADVSSIVEPVQREGLCANNKNGSQCRLLEHRNATDRAAEDYQQRSQEYREMTKEEYTTARKKEILKYHQEQILPESENIENILAHIGKRYSIIMGNPIITDAVALMKICESILTEEDAERSVLLRLICTTDDDDLEECEDALNTITERYVELFNSLSADVSIDESDMSSFIMSTELCKFPDTCFSTVCTKLHNIGMCDTPQGLGACKCSLRHAKLCRNDRTCRSKACSFYHTLSPPACRPLQCEKLLCKNKHDDKFHYTPLSEAELAQSLEIANLDAFAAMRGSDFEGFEDMRRDTVFRK